MGDPGVEATPPVAPSGRSIKVRLSPSHAPRTPDTLNTSISSWSPWPPPTCASRTELSLRSPLSPRLPHLNGHSLPLATRAPGRCSRSPTRVFLDICSNHTTTPHIHTHHALALLRSKPPSGPQRLTGLPAQPPNTAFPQPAGPAPLSPPPDSRTRRGSNQDPCTRDWHTVPQAPAQALPPVPSSCRPPQHAGQGPVPSAWGHCLTHRWP